MNDNVVIRYIDLPTRIRGFVICDVDDFMNIYINARLSYEAQQRAIKHELEHIRNNDFYNDADIRHIEGRATL